MMSFADPIPVVIRIPNRGRVFERHGVALGAYHNGESMCLLVVDGDGFFHYVETGVCRAKFPPSGPYRLLLGWAEKGGA